MGGSIAVSVVVGELGDPQSHHDTRLATLPYLLNSSTYMSPSDVFMS